MYIAKLVRLSYGPDQKDEKSFTYVTAKIGSLLYVDIYLGQAQVPPVILPSDTARGSQQSL